MEKKNPLLDEIQKKFNDSKLILPTSMKPPKPGSELDGLVQYITYQVAEQTAGVVIACVNQMEVMRKHITELERKVKSLE